MPVLCNFIKQGSNNPCGKRASYGNKETKIKERCGTHKTSIMIDLNNPLCDICGKQAIFGIKDNKPLKCLDHKTSEMIDLKHRKCEDCDQRAYWGLLNNPKTKCFDHKTSEMIREKDRKCIFPGCPTKPIFGTELGVPTHCDLHKDSTMSDVVNKKCIIDKCPIRPTFNYKGLKAEYCEEHMKKGMVNVNDKLCEEKDCITRASFGIELKKPTHCLLHKEPSMFNVVSKSCEKCKIHQPVYGKPGSPSSHCVGCREPGMIRRSKTKCKTKNCKQPAVYGTKGTANHCETHKKSDELNYVEKPCVKCNLPMILDKDDVCEFCNPEMFKNARLEKQNNLLNYLDKNIKNDNILFISTDNIIDKGDCGDERPDRVYELYDRIIIVECDEHQHKDRPCLCEQTRMINISQKFMSEISRPVYFIRFNPDDYKPGNGEDMVDIKDRYKYITSLIKDLLMNDNNIVNDNSFLSVCYLYFDQWIEENKDLKSLWISLLDFDK
jgi:hypothetical protein